MKSFFTFLILSFSIHCFSQENDSLTVFLEKEMKEQKIPGLQAVVIKDNKIIYSNALGLANVSFENPVNNKTIFSINSIGKIFTSTAIMQLREEGKLRLLDSISMHLPELPENWNKITIKDLLSHTSGLPNIEDPITEELIGSKGIDIAWEMVQKMPIQSKPKEEFEYNATNYFLLYKIIEKCSNKSFQEFIQEKQFTIARMSRIIYGNSFDVDTNKSPTYSYYYQNKVTGDYFVKEKLRELSEEYPKELTTDSGAFTSAEDMAKWIIALLEGKLLKDREDIEIMWKPVKLNNGNYKGLGGILNAYALGWPVVKRDDHIAVSPLGGGRASVFIYPKDNLSVILFTNLMGSYPHDIADRMAKLYFN
jgi:CubicO group peptidase (beta-lactamase class C family)